MTELRINLDDTERVKTFSRAELFQLDAYEQVERIVRHASDKLADIDEENAKRISECRTHNAIFITGERGVGKTAFLVNISKYISENWGEEKQPAFLKPIDPTILEKEEYFLSIIIGHIIEYVESKVAENAEESTDNYRKYYNAIDPLSQSLRAARAIDDTDGIEEIISSQNNLKLEQNVHAFFQAACSLLDIPFIVFAIDDIDMSFEQGFQILETIRKYMASPFVIPVITGDPALYKSILFQNFQKKLIGCDLDQKDLHQFVGSLTEKYLSKVFPAEYRVYLRDVFDILRQRKTILITEETSCGYNLWKDVEIRVQNYRVNQKEFTNQILDNNARSFIQYLVSKKDMVKLLAENFENANEMTVHKPFDPSDSMMMSIDAFIQNHIFGDHFAAYKTGMLKTAQIYTLSADKALVAKTAQNEALAVVQAGYSQYRQFKSDFFMKGERPVFKPDREPLVSSLFIAKTGKTAASLVKIRKKDPFFGLLCDIFTHDDFYSSYQTKKFLLSGRFLEIMFLSLDPLCLDERTFSRLFTSIPYNANFNVSKYVPLADDEEGASDGDVLTDASEFDVNAIEADKLIHQIKRWHADHFKDAKHILPTQFIHQATNKFFNNINVLKMGTYDSKKHLEQVVQVSSRWGKNSEPAIVFFQRIVFIFLNAVASFENQGRVSHTNIAVGKAFKGSDSIKYDNAFRFNIAPLETATTFSFCKAFSLHPLVKAILAYAPNSPTTDDLMSIEVGTKTVAVAKATGVGKRSAPNELAQFKYKWKSYPLAEMDELKAEKFVDDMIQYLYKVATRMKPLDKEAIRKYIDTPNSKPSQALLKFQNEEIRQSEYEKLISPLIR